MRSGSFVLLVSNRGRLARPRRPRGFAFRGAVSWLSVRGRGGAAARFDEAVDEFEDGALLGGRELFDPLQAFKEARGPGGAALAERGDAQQRIGGDPEEASECDGDGAPGAGRHRSRSSDHAIGDADGGAQSWVSLRPGGLLPPDSDTEPGGARVSRSPGSQGQRGDHALPAGLCEPDTGLAEALQGLLFHLRLVLDHAAVEHARDRGAGLLRPQSGHEMRGRFRRFALREGRAAGGVVRLRPAVVCGVELARDAAGGESRQGGPDVPAESVL